MTAHLTRCATFGAVCGAMLAGAYSLGAALTVGEPAAAMVSGAVMVAGCVGMVKLYVWRPV